MDDVNKLLVLVEANTRSYENAMKKLEGITKSAGRKSSSGFDPVKRVLKDVESGTGRVGNSVTRMQRELAAAAQKTVKPFELNRMQMQNMSFQINDLAQGLATGQQSPFVLIAQQGSQIAQIFGSGTGVVSALKATGGAIVSFVTNPINLAVIGIAAATVAVPALWNAFTSSEGNAASERIKEIEKGLEAANENLVGLKRNLREIRLGVDADELALLDAIAAKTRDIADAQDILERSSGHARRNAQNKIGREQEALEVLQQQLQETRNLEREKENLERIVTETTNSERLLGEQMLVSAENARRTEGIAKLLKAGVSAVTVEALELAGIDLSKPITSASDANEILKLGLSDSQIAALEIGNTAISAEISKAADEADRLAENLFKATRIGFRQELSDEDLAFSQEVIPDSKGRDNQRKALASFLKSTAPKKTRTRSTPKITNTQKEADKRSREIEREQEAVDNLVKSLQSELDLVGATELARRQANATRNLGASVTDEQRAKIQQLTEDLYLEQEAWNQTQEAQQFFENAAANSLSGLIDGTLSAEDAVKQLTNSIIQAGLQAVLLGEGPLAGLFGDQGSSGGILGSLFKGFGGGSGASSPAATAAFAAGSGGLFANGAAFSNGNVIPFANGGVVSSPTLFPMAGGKTGLMGEAGAEAIMPLTRDSAGRLGVRASGGGQGQAAPRTIINIKNYGNDNVETSERNDGGINIQDIVIGEVNRGISNGQSDESMSRFGVKPQPRRVG